MTSKPSRLFRTIIKCFGAFAIVLSYDSALSFGNLESEAENIHKHNMEYNNHPPAPPVIEHPKHNPTMAAATLKKEMPENLNNLDHKEISDIELQRILDALPEKDKKIIKALQKQIAKWPEATFREVREYNEFMMIANKIAKEKYSNLSAAAKKALESEESLKKNLSSDALTSLSTLHVEF